MMRDKQCNQCLWQGTTSHTCRNTKSRYYSVLVTNYVCLCEWYSSIVGGPFKSEKSRGVRQIRKL